jgi:uncharacterized LabA/DUF88 family protein
MRKRIKYLKKFPYTGEEIRKYCISHLKTNDYLYRIFYYDTEPLRKIGTNPITSQNIDFGKTDVAIEQEKLLESIKHTPNFALRLGKTAWKNDWILNQKTLKKLINKQITVDALKEKDIQPVIRQKAVDMKMGLDIALIATKKLADLLIIITGDADIVPVLKFARREGMQVCLDPLRNPVQPDLTEHVDFIDSKI